MQYETVEQFRWDILWEAVFEDDQMLWEPLSSLRTLGLKSVNDEDLKAVAERVLRQLLAEGLIYFYRLPLESTTREETEDLEAAEVDAELSSDWWGGDVNSDRNTVWWAATEKGIKALEDPPESIKDFFKRRDDELNAQWSPRGSEAPKGPRSHPRVSRTQQSLPVPDADG